MTLDLLNDLNCRDRSYIVLEYLKRNSSIIDRLYNHPASCSAVFSELPTTGQDLIIRLLFVDTAVSHKEVCSWVDPKYTKEYEVIAQSLVDLRVWQEETTTKGEPGWLLTSTFRNKLKVVFLGCENEWSMKRSTETGHEAIDLSFLDRYAIQKWDCILHCILGTKKDGISPAALQTLHHAGLALMENYESTSLITKAGFQFLMIERSAQFWYFILKYLDSATARNLDLVECLGFLFQVSKMSRKRNLGLGYSTDGMSEGLLNFLQHLGEFGLIYQEKRDSGRFYVTRLALHSNCMPSTNVDHMVVNNNIIIEGMRNLPSK